MLRIPATLIFALILALTPRSLLADEAELKKDIDKLKASLKELTGTFEKFREDQVRSQEVTRALSQTCAPVGTVIGFAGQWPPLKADGTSFTEDQLGWMLCDGRALKSGEHRELFAVLKKLGGDGSFDAATKQAASGCDFNLPDYRGAFLRGADLGRGLDQNVAERTAAIPGGAAKDQLGSFQADMIQSHKHLDSGHTHEHNAAVMTGRVQSDDSDQGAAPESPPKATIQPGKANLGDPVDSGTGAGPVRHGKETRPVNVTVYWIIKTKIATAVSAKP